MKLPTQTYLLTQILIIVALVTAIHVWYWLAVIGTPSYPTGEGLFAVRSPYWRAILLPVRYFLRFFWSEQWKFVRTPMFGTIQAIALQSMVIILFMIAIRRMFVMIISGNKSDLSS